MVKVRSAPSNTPKVTSTSRKRSHEQESPKSSSRRRIDEGPEMSRLFEREGSPTKNVHFPRGPRLIQGPTWSDPRRRSESPTRSALTKRDQGQDEASAQLLAEQGAAQAPRARTLKRKTIKSKSIQGLRNPRLAIDPYNAALLPQSAAGGVGSRPKPKSVAPPAVSGPKSDLLDIPDAPAEPAEETCQRMDELRSMVRTFAQSFPPVPDHHKHNVVGQLMKPENDQLIRYIGCLAMGGTNGIEGWRAVLSSTTCRHALVFGIIGRALKEAVFSELYFGAQPELAQKLSKMEREQAIQDGFYRTRQRADAIDQASKSGDTASLRKAISRTVIQLQHMLLPLWKQGGSATTWHQSSKKSELAQIVDAAASLSREMRKSPDVVYYWPPTFKDEEFEPARMECLNLENMIRNSPYDKRAVQGHDRAIVRPGQEDRNEAIVRVVCFPGLVAYRQYGGDLAMRELEEEKSRPDHAPPDVKSRRKILDRHGQELTPDNGFRTRVICKSVVLLEWGKQRLLTKEAGTSRHLDAMKNGGMSKYDKDYEDFVELYNYFEQAMEGVPRSARGDAVSQRPSPSRKPSWSIFG